MKRYTLLFIIAIATIAIIVGAFLLYKDNPMEDRRVTAVNIALNDKRVQEALKYSPKNDTDNGTAMNHSAIYGFINDSRSLENVVFLPNRTSFYTLATVVDLNDSRVTSIFKYDHRYETGNGSLILPPGASWYHRMTLLSSIHGPKIDFSPVNGRLMIIIVNGTNLENYKNGTLYYPAEVLDIKKNETVIFNGAQPIASGWNAELRIYEGSYIILKNEGDKELEINISLFYFV